jgi:hypothetical protein
MDILNYLYVYETQIARKYSKVSSAFYDKKQTIMK